jgi:tungstate transport system substrate-binding protein
VITVNPEKWPGINLEAAGAFADFITSDGGQKIIGEFGVKEYGQPLFFPDAGKTDAELGVP